MRIATRPMKKVGREKVTREPVTDAESKKPPRLLAATTPRDIPTTIESRVANPTRARVFYTLPKISLPTGCEV